jgi:hypothetical protein
MKNPVKKIKIGGKEFPLSFGINQSILYCNLRNISITEMEGELANIETSDGSSIRDLLWSALKDGARREGIEFEYTNYDVGDMMEEPSVIASFMESLNESIGNGPDVKIDNDEPQKKT